MTPEMWLKILTTHGTLYFCSILMKTKKSLKVMEIRDGCVMKKIMEEFLIWIMRLDLTFNLRVIFRNFHQNIENLKSEVVVIGSRRWLHLLRISWRRSVIKSGRDEVRRFALKEAKQSKDGGTRRLNPSNLKLRLYSLQPYDVQNI
uniref:Uncharacterized protein n=1 Tax=Cucumis melo TaxID=3656 RepID=A0A9I9E5H6_CUCME